MTQSTHDLLKAEKIVNAGIGVLEREMALPNLFWKWSINDFVGALDDTVNVKVPGKLTARDRKLRAEGEDRKIQLDFLSESKIGVQLTEFPYSATGITDEQLTLDIENFGMQIINPQIKAMAVWMENYCAGVLEGAAYADGTPDKTSDKTVKGTLKAEDFYGPGHLGMPELFARIRRNLNRRYVPENERYVVIGADFEEEILNCPGLVEADKSGDSTALRDATIGKLRGFNCIVSNSIDPTTAYAFHRTAFPLANAAPMIPKGAKFGATTNFNGLSLRWIMDYDADYAQDRSIFDCFAGSGVVTDGGKFMRGIKITMDGDRVASLKAGSTAAAGGTD